MPSWRRTHDWGALTSGEIAQAGAAGALPVLPLGACEQHAGHLPVDTDAVSVDHVARLAAARCTEAFALVLPTLPFGVSPEHAAWPGTVTLPLAAFAALVTEVARSVARSGFDRLLLLNGHGGNQAPLEAIVADLAGSGLRVAAVNYWSPGQAEWTRQLPGAKATMGHACAYETGLQLALRPDERERILAAAAGLPPRLTRPGRGPPYPMVFAAGDPGYYGDPAAATAESGAALLETTVAALAGCYAAFARPD